MPPVRNRRWPRTPIDAFVLARIEQGSPTNSATTAAPVPTPALEADRRSWIRRVTFDLIGLPPTTDEIESFLADHSARAHEKVVERLLASPHYGERWGRHWLDVVRYADTAGDSADYPVPQAHRYRDYVIAAFNEDKPYDRFIREQLAGDLLPAPSQARRNEQIIATGFIAISRRFGTSGGSGQHLTIEDTLETLGRSMLGLSLSCARCHDHKHDPISTEDYYALYGIFASTRYPHAGSEEHRRQADFVPLLPAAETESIRRAHADRVAELDAGIARVEQSLGSIPADQMKGHPLQAEFDRLWRERDALSGNPLGTNSAYAVAEAASGGTNVAVQHRGDPFQPGRVVPRRFLTVLGGAALPTNAPQSGRLELAGWLTHPSNPLPARVMVNRIWQHHFGRGLVATPNDFGTRGRPPSHPELLDWLATRFIESGWSIKAMHRLIVLSSTYRQAALPPASSASSATGASGAADTIPSISTVTPNADPENTLLARFPRQRLDAEQLRDALLVTSGQLDPTPAGPHSFPAETTWNFTQHTPYVQPSAPPSSSAPAPARRSVYALQQRIQRDRYFELFDGADPNASTGERQVTITPLQALFALNDPFVHEQANAFAERLLSESPDSPATAPPSATGTATDAWRIDRAHRLALGRPARPDEITDGLEHLTRVRHALTAGTSTAAEQNRQAWASYARALLAGNEFLFVD